MWRLLPESSSEAAWRLVTPVKDAEMKLPALQVTCFSELGSRPEWQNVALMSRTLTAFSRRPDFWLRVAVLSGMLPLVLGLAVFAIHYYTRAAIWLTAGGVVILIGLAMVLLGAFAIVRYVKCARSNKENRGTINKNAAFASMLLLSNFPVVCLCLFVAVVRMSVERVTLTNESSIALHSIQVTWPHGELDIPELLPGQSTQMELMIDADGAALFTGTHGDHECGGTLLGYVTTSMGSDHQLSIRQDCSIHDRE
jgi:hypothetical protein